MKEFLDSIVRTVQPDVLQHPLGYWIELSEVPVTSQTETRPARCLLLASRANRRISRAFAWFDLFSCSGGPLLTSSHSEAFWPLKMKEKLMLEGVLTSRVVVVLLSYGFPDVFSAWSSCACVQALARDRVISQLAMLPGLMEPQRPQQSQYFRLITLMGCTLESIPKYEEHAVSRALHCSMHACMPA